MGARNGHSVFDIITNGWSRKVHKINGQGTLGIGLPAEYVDEQAIAKGDNVAIRRAEDRDGVLELHFE